MILGITDTTMAAKWSIYDLTNFYEPFKSIATTQDDGDTESGNVGYDMNCICKELKLLVLMKLKRLLMF